ncbi:MAG: DUF2703 domain-containing protein [Ignavibacteria bacterium]|nr:DUF2703 domain-containing protein [Ignavibacteria bacterium]
MKTLKIKWQRLISEGQTCPRCNSTEKELNKAFLTLKKSLVHFGIEVILEKNEISIAEFQKDPLKSNAILINDKPLEDWVNGKVGSTNCCDVCGPYDCRTIEMNGEIYETIPSELIIKAGLLASSQLIDPQTSFGCCEGVDNKANQSNCC